MTTTILCHLCPWTGPHLAAFWLHIYDEHREIWERSNYDRSMLEEKP